MSGSLGQRDGGDTYDILVVGGGINGCGIARDAAGRGLSVLLCERDDLASHTSSWSSKLVHGGLRYLEHYEFRLVRESLLEREVLMRAAPHLIRPLRFILPHHRGLRPAWMLRTGLFLYDHIGGRKLLPPTRTIDLRRSPYGRPLKEEFGRGFEYSDCFADDARLVVVNAVDAADRGADIRTRTELVHAERAGDHWRCHVSKQSGGTDEIRTRILVNAAGPWVRQVIDGIEEITPRKAVRLVKGSHIVVSARFEHDRAYILQNADGRIVFAIPYLGGSTLIGTTDLPYEGDPASAAISDEEIEYLLNLVNGYFRQPCTRGDILSTYSGVRPLYDDLSQEDVSAVTRDYAFDIDAEESRPPLLSVYGGKLTTYRKLAEHALDRLAPFLPQAAGRWTERSRLPGGDVAFEGFEAFEDTMRSRYAFLPKQQLGRLLGTHGTDLPRVLGDAETAEDLGEDLGLGLTEAEIRHFRDREFAVSTDDILLRRTKLGLADREGETRKALGQYLSEA